MMIHVANDTNRQIKFKTTMLRSRFCHSYILVSGTITVATGPAGRGNDIEEVFKNWPPFTDRINRIKNT